MAKKKRRQRNDPKRNWMVGILIFAMLAFVLTQIPWNNFTNSTTKKTTTNTSQTTKSTTTLDKAFAPESAVTITDADGKEIIKVDIEVARTKAERDLGLMHRRKLPDHGGMLFIMDTEKLQSFWMRNTYIPLDIIYVNAKKEIVHIAENTTPLSDNPVPSIFPAKYVLEVNAGFSKAYGLTKGNILNFNI